MGSSIAYHQPSVARTMLGLCRQSKGLHSDSRRPEPSQPPRSPPFEAVIETLMLPHVQGGPEVAAWGKGGEKACRGSSIEQSISQASIPSLSPPEMNSLSRNLHFLPRNNEGAAGRPSEGWYAQKGLAAGRHANALIRKSRLGRGWQAMGRRHHNVTADLKQHPISQQAGYKSLVCLFPWPA